MVPITIHCKERRYYSIGPFRFHSIPFHVHSIPSIPFHSGSAEHRTDTVNPKSAISGDKPSDAWRANIGILPLDKLKDGCVNGFLKIIKMASQCIRTSKAGSGYDCGPCSKAVTWIEVLFLAKRCWENCFMYGSPIHTHTPLWNTKNYFPTTGKTWWKDPETFGRYRKKTILYSTIVFLLCWKRKAILPDNVPNNEFLNLEGWHKISTSPVTGRVWLHEYLQDFPANQDVCANIDNAPETRQRFAWKIFKRVTTMSWWLFTVTL